MHETTIEGKSSGLVPLGVASLASSDVINPEHANDLRWYFRVGGLAVFDRSTMSHMLERAQLMFTHARACRKCGGDPKRNIGGCGWMPSTKKRRKPTGPELALLRWMRSRRVTLPARGDTPCTRCKGRGWIEAGRRKRMGPLTARPMGSSVKQSGGITVGDVGMQRLGIVGARLERVSTKWPLAQDILCAWYGPDEGGRLIALWPMTPAGKTLLRRNSLDLDALRFFENERDDANKKRDVQRLALFDGADEQAGELRAGAARLWNAMVEDVPLALPLPVEVASDAA